MEYKGYKCKVQLVRENPEKYNEAIKIGQSDDVYELVKEIENLNQEVVLIISLDMSSKVIGINEIAKGGANGAGITAKEAFIPVLLSGGSRCIMVHNHPSGESKPSNSDLMMTRRIKEAGKVIGVDLLDHVIVGYNNHFSFSSERLI